MKERLATEIINSGILQQCVHYNDLKITAEAIAGYLIGHAGVTIPPVKVGDVVYQHDGVKIYKSKVVGFYYDKDYKRIVYDCDTDFAFDKTAIGSSVFLSREKALEDMK